MSQSAFAGYGLKSISAPSGALLTVPSQSAFAGYGLKSWHGASNTATTLVAIRFRWIWVEKYKKDKSKESDRASQSAFAGYGLKRVFDMVKGLASSLSQSAFAGYGLKSL